LLRDACLVEPVVYREEVLTIMGVLGDIAWNCRKYTTCYWVPAVKKRKKRTPEEIARERQWRAESDANLRRLRDLVDRGWEELEERRRREPATDT
jgi:hypothetical protein